MKLKKKPEKDLEKYRPLFFKTGLMIALIVTLLFMEWSSSVSMTKTKFSVLDADFEVEYLPPTTSEKREPPKPSTQVFDIFDLDNAEEEDFEPMDNGVENDEAILFTILNEESQKDNDLVVTFPPIGSKFSGGYENLMKFISKNIKYPTLALENNIEGKVFIHFVVDKKGHVKDAKVIRSIDSLLDKEALRVVNLLPDWKPAMSNGKPVCTGYTIPVTFRIQ